MLYALLCAIIAGVSVFWVISIGNYKRKLYQATCEISDFKNREIDIQTKVENIKDEMKLITDLYIASDSLIHMQTEIAVYNEMFSMLQKFYNCRKLSIYSFDEERMVFEKAISTDNNIAQFVPVSNAPKYNTFSPNEIITVVTNAQGKPVYLLEMADRRTSTPNGFMVSLFTDTDINVLNVYLKQSSMVIDRLKAYKKMELMALTDNLTGLYNRHYAYIRIRQELKRAAREGYPISVMFVDIDKFKSINDTFGHDIGDIALKHVSSIIKSSKREYDVPIRWGGEEFLIVLPNTTGEGAYVLAERLREHIQNSNFKYCNITTSLGIATYPYDNNNIEKVISCADTALYYSKESGRNRTSVYKQLPQQFKCM